MIHKTPKKKGNGGQMQNGANKRRSKASKKKTQKKRHSIDKLKRSMNTRTA